MTTACNLGQHYPVKISATLYYVCGTEVCDSEHPKHLLTPARADDLVFAALAHSQWWMLLLDGTNWSPTQSCEWTLMI